jgi:hypothetical protein
MRTAGRRAFDLLESGITPLVPRVPRLALAGATALGALRNRLSRRWPDPEEIRRLFPSLDPATSARVAWMIGGLEARNRVLASCLRRTGPDPLRSLVRIPASLTALRPPLLLGTFHVGAVHALLPALERLPGPVLALRQGLLATPRPPVEVVNTEGDDQRRAAVFQRALTHLGAGGFVVLALDVAPGPGLRVPCLNRTLELARGPFALARLARVPLVPLVARWRRGGVEIVTGEALAPSPGPSPAPRGRDGEGVLATAAAGWLERYLLEAPSELGLGLLRALLGSEVTPPTADR